MWHKVSNPVSTNFQMCGLTLSCDMTDLAIKYLATIQAIAVSVVRQEQYFNKSV